MVVWIDLGVIRLASVFIWLVGDKFSEASSSLGDFLNLPRSVKGATFDAVSSSLPELMVALFSLIAFSRFDLGVSVVTGSALFNLLIIPALSVLLSKHAFKISKKVVKRDGLFYLGTAVFLLIALILGIWNILTGIVFLAMYGLYIFLLRRDSKKHAKRVGKTKPALGLKSALFWAIVGILVIAFCSYFLTGSALSLSTALGIPPLLIGFTVVAAATSVPDTAVSVINARKGDIDASASNVFGSNSFDILIGLGLPILLAAALGFQIVMDATHIEMVFGLVLATIAVLFLLSKRYTLNKAKAVGMLALYAAFVLYAVLASFPA